MIGLPSDRVRVQNGQITINDKPWILRQYSSDEETDSADFNYFIDDVKYKQINKPNATGYLAETQHIELSEKIVEQFNQSINEKSMLISELKEIIQQQKSIINKIKSN